MSLFIAVLRNQMLFYQQSATLLSSGMTILDALDILIRQAPGASLRAACSRIKGSIAQGNSFADSIERVGIFPTWQIGIIRYSETAGKVSESISFLAEYSQREYETAQKLISAMIYPVFLLHLAIIALPISVFVQKGMAPYMVNVLRVLIPVYAAIAGFFLIRKISGTWAKIFFDRIMCVVPLLSMLVRRFSIARFIRSLQCLSASGVSIIQAWQSASGSCQNSVIRKQFLRGLSGIESGGSLAEAFKAAKIFSPAMIGMVAAGQASGSISGMLKKMAELAERENYAAIDMMANSIPVIIYVGVAGYVGARVVSFYTNYFNALTLPLQ